MSDGHKDARHVLRVLFAEDSEDDAVLVLRQLRKGGWQVESERVETQQEFVRQLDTHPDLIIADHTMPGFGAKRALELLQGCGDDIPLIIVSGTIEPENAVALMKAGARDYLSKNDLSRLVPVINRELHESEMRRQGRAVEAETRKLSNVVEQTANAIFITDRDGTIEYVNRAFETVTGYSKEEAIGRKPDILKSDKHDAEYFRLLWDTILQGDDFQDVMVNRKKNGTLYYEEKTISPLKNDQGDITHFISTGLDITEKLQIQERLQYLAYHDILTELPNRAHLMNRLEYALLRCQRSEEHFALLLINLDRFNIINDTLGREVGDDALQVQVERMQGIIGRNDTLARLIGDEFAILLEGLRSPDELPAVADKILSTLAKPIKMGRHEFYLGASLGISIYPEDGDDSLILLRGADSALHRAKEMGGNCYHFYSPEMSVTAFERLGMESRLRRALENQELLLHFQPQVDIHTGEIACMEALLRWQHPQDGMIMPNRFIPLLEETGLIIPVGEWVLETACREASQWQSWAHHPVRVGVNLSGRQFIDPTLAGTVARILHESGLPPEMLELEITESTIMQNAQQTVDTLKALSDIGVKLSIDDFGTGYSSLAYLKRFSVDSLKIDRSFVQDIIYDPDSFSIAKSIIALAHSLNLDVVAEGIETDSQLRMLSLLDCDLIQGYLVSRPVDEEQAAKLLVAHEPFVTPAIHDNRDNRTLLLVDDDPNILSALKRVLHRENYEIITATSGHEGLELLARHDAGVILSDQRMPHMNGTEFLNRVRRLHPTSIRMVLTGYTNLDTITDAVNTGHIYKFISKPWEDDFLLASVREAFDAYNSRARAVPNASASV